MHVNRKPSGAHPINNNAPCLHDVEADFGLQGFPGLAPAQIPARALIRQFIVWWRTLESANAAQQAACARQPGTIRLIDTISNCWVERG